MVHFKFTKDTAVQKRKKKQATFGNPIFLFFPLWKVQFSFQDSVQSTVAFLIREETLPSDAKAKFEGKVAIYIHFVSIF